jgi:hypothetical protein
MYIPYNVRARIRLPWMKSCLYADFGFGARYFQVVDTGECMVELYYVLPLGSHAKPSWGMKSAISFPMMVGSDPHNYQRIIEDLEKP